jgi:hypothetical protein
LFQSPEGPLTRPFVRLLGGNDEPPLFNGNFDALSCFKSCVFDPPTGELHPRIKRWLGAKVGGRGPVTLKAPRLLNGHESFRDE